MLRAGSDRWLSVCQKDDLTTDLWDQRYWTRVTHMNNQRRTAKLVLCILWMITQSLVITCAFPNWRPVISTLTRSIDFRMRKSQTDFMPPIQFCLQIWKFYESGKIIFVFTINDHLNHYLGRWSFAQSRELHEIVQPHQLGVDATQAC